MFPASDNDSAASSERRPSFEATTWPALPTDIPRSSLYNEQSFRSRSSEEDAHFGASPSLDGYLIHQHMQHANSDVRQEGPAPPTSPETHVECHAAGYLSDSHLYPKSRGLGAAPPREFPSFRRTRSRKAVLERKRNHVIKHALARGTVAPGQPAKGWRVRDGRHLEMKWRGPEHVQVFTTSLKTVYMCLWLCIRLIEPDRSLCSSLCAARNMYKRGLRDAQHSLPSHPECSLLRRN
jgi:hypothetical protein